jgi:NDP-4-keto-2,6-dideoxyhexose 3-C-methyltransferase
MIQPITGCRACEDTNLTEFLALGEQYLSDFRDDDSRPPKYPLTALICNNCKLVQLKHSTPQAEMYHERYGFKSGISDSIKNDLRDIVLHAQKYRDNPKSWLDIASNDGTLLSYVPDRAYRIGVDPVGFLCKEARQINRDAVIVNDYFKAGVVGGLDQGPEGFDVITSISCFYDMPDPSRFVEDVVSVLAKDGVWIIQQNYLLTTMQLFAVDNFCHEHLEYYTLLSLENLLWRFGLEVNEVHLSDVNGGSIRTIVSRKGTYPIDESVEAQRRVESEYKLDTVEPYQIFAANVWAKLNQLHDMVEGLKAAGKSVYILAASTRGGTIWQSAGIDSSLVDFAVERNPAKVGKWFSAVGVPIISEETARVKHPSCMLVGPWFFADEIIDREAEYLENGGQLIIPLPEIRVV